MLSVDRRDQAHRQTEGFHRADCQAAAEISTQKLVKYNTRDEAIQAVAVTPQIERPLKR